MALQHFWGALTVHSRCTQGALRVHSQLSWERCQQKVCCVPGMPTKQSLELGWQEMNMAPTCKIHTIHLNDSELACFNCGACPFHVNLFGRKCFDRFLFESVSICFFSQVLFGDDTRWSRVLTYNQLVGLEQLGRTWIIGIGTKMGRQSTPRQVLWSWLSSAARGVALQGRPCRGWICQSYGYNMLQPVDSHLRTVL